MANRAFIHILLFLSLVFFISSPALAQENSAATVTLKELFNTALKNNERIGISDEAARKSQALYRQTLGETLPEVNYKRRAGFEQNSKTGHDGYFQVSKTDLSVFREFASLRAANATAHQKRYERHREEQLLLLDVAAAFYNYLLAEQNTASTTKLNDLAGERLAELNKRVKLGKTRQADALSEEVLLSNLNSQLEESQRQVGERRDLLSFLVVESFEGRNFSDNLTSIQPLSIESYLATLESRPDIQAAKENVNSFKGLLEVTRAEFFPTLDASFNAYSDRSLLADKNVDWDATVSLNVPIWDWVARGAAMDASGAELKQSEESLSLAARQAELEIRNAYRNLVSAKKQIEILQKSLDAARKDYELQVKDDSQGLVTSLEVLASLDRLNTAELAFNDARLQEKIASICLQIASGSDPQEILK